MDEFDSNACKAEMKKCINTKMAKLKPATIVSIIAGLIVLIGLTTGGIWAQYHAGVMERQENTKYMILAEAGKSREKLNDCVKKDTFHAVDKKLYGLETKVENINTKVEKLNERSEKVLEAIERMERRSNNSGSNQ